jgi:hypothetical protein
MDQTQLGFLTYGLAAAWVLLCLYIVSLVVRERKTRAQIENLKRIVEEREGK